MCILHDPGRNKRREGGDRYLPSGVLLGERRRRTVNKSEQERFDRLVEICASQKFAIEDARKEQERVLKKLRERETRIKREIKNLFE